MYLKIKMPQRFQHLEPEQTDRNTDAGDRQHYQARNRGR